MITRRGLFKRLLGAVVAAVAAPKELAHWHFAPTRHEKLWVIGWSERGGYGIFPKGVGLPGMSGTIRTGVMVSAGRDGGSQYFVGEPDDDGILESWSEFDDEDDDDDDEGEDSPAGDSDDDDDIDDGEEEEWQL